MTAKSNLAQKVPADIALVVYGTDRSQKPHASRFGSGAAKSAQAAARAMGMQTLRIVSDQQREVARRLPQGTVSAKGRTVVPLIQPAMYQKLLAMAGSDAPATPPNAPPNSDHKPTPDAKSDSSDGWSKLAKGNTVLAFDPDDGVWWEAIVQHRDGDTLTLTWREFPDLPKFNRKVTQVGILHPAMGRPW